MMNYFAYVRSRQRHGFSLVELVVVLLILGILAAAAAPRYVDALGKYRANATAKRLSADLESARRQARQTSSPQAVEFYLPENRYVLPGMTHPDRRSQTFEVHVDDPAYCAMLVSADFGGESSITFNMYGQPDNAGTVVVQSGSHQRKVRIDASGAITIQ